MFGWHRASDLLLSMGSNKRKKRKGGGGGRPVLPKDPTAIAAELEPLVGEIEAGSGDATWGSVHKILLKSPIDPQDAARVITLRDVDGLRGLITQLRTGNDADEATDAATSDAHAACDSASPASSIPDDTLKKALRAFRKRVKLTRLDHESRLGHGPMSSGKKASFDGILPPREFPTEVWEALSDQGHLKRLGRGFYQLLDE